MQAFVLHARRYGDSSLLVELTTRERGRLGCIAKGALQRRRGGTPLQPFQSLQVGLRGRGEVATLTQAEPLAPPLRLTGRRLFCGLYLNELLHRLTAREDPLPALFDDYADTLAALQRDAALEPLLRGFEIMLLAHLGIGLRLDTDIRGDPVRAGSHYTYSVDDGAVPVAVATDGTVAGDTLGALHRGEFTSQRQLDEARRLMRRIIGHHLGGRALKSRELFR